jgi:hypothetical protein
VTHEATVRGFFFFFFFFFLTSICVPELLRATGAGAALGTGMQLSKGSDGEEFVLPTVSVAEQLLGVLSACEACRKTSGGVCQSQCLY